MNDYLIARHVHLTAVVLTLLFFVARGIGALAGAGWLRKTWVRVTPHVIDTVLLLSALYLAVVVYGYPANPQGWITAKLVGLVVYIVLGTFAIKRAPTTATRAAAFAGALVVFAYIVTTAVTRSPIPF